MSDPTPVYSPNEFSLADIAPERATFHDNAYGGDGARHEWQMLSDLGPAHVAMLRRIQDELSRAYAVIGATDASAQKLEQAGAKLMAAFDAFLKLILPTLPAERIAALPFGAKERMLTWWNARQPKAEGQALPLAQAAPATPPAKRSRASSASTA
jgi:hypothetical protein